MSASASGDGKKNEGDGSDDDGTDGGDGSDDYEDSHDSGYEDEDQHVQNAFARPPTPFEGQTVFH